MTRRVAGGWTGLYICRGVSGNGGEQTMRKFIIVLTGLFALVTGGSFYGSRAMLPGTLEAALQSALSESGIGYIGTFDSVEVASFARQITINTLTLTSEDGETAITIGAIEADISLITSVENIMALFTGRGVVTVDKFVVKELTAASSHYYGQSSIITINEFRATNMGLSGVAFDLASDPKLIIPLDAHQIVDRLSVDWLGIEGLILHDPIATGSIEKLLLLNVSDAKVETLLLYNSGFNGEVMDVSVQRLKANQLNLHTLFGDIRERSSFAQGAEATNIVLSDVGYNTINLNKFIYSEEGAISNAEAGAVPERLAMTFERLGMELGSLDAQMGGYLSASGIDRLDADLDVTAFWQGPEESLEIFASLKAKELADAEIIAQLKGVTGTLYRQFFASLGGLREVPVETITVISAIDGPPARVDTEDAETSALEAHADHVTGELALDVVDDTPLAERISLASGTIIYQDRLLLPKLKVGLAMSFGAYIPDFEQLVLIYLELQKLEVEEAPHVVAVIDGIETFFLNPHTVHLTAAPAAPVSLSELGSLTHSPGRLIDRLGIEFSASE